MSVSAPHDFTVLICGSGSVAHAIALGFAQRSIKTALLAQSAPPLPEEGFDERVFAITPPNIRFLAGLGFWSKLRAERLADIAEMRIHPPAKTEWPKDSPTTLSLNASSVGGERLAVLVEHRELLRVGDECVRQMANTPQSALTLIPAQSVVAIENKDSSVTCQLTDGQRISAQLFIAADGADSAVRKLLNLPTHWDDYGDACLVGNFVTERPHYQIAEQWFDDDGVFATLPFVDGQVSLAWSCRMAKAQALYAQREELPSALHRASRGRLGTFTPSSKLAIFPLRRMSPQKTVVGRVMLVGDSAHLVHPMMGLGLNLGLGDGAEVIKQFAHIPSIERFSSWHKAVYETRRSVEVRAIAGLTHALHALYLKPSAERSPLSVLTDKALPTLATGFMRATQSAPFIKSALVKWMTQ